MNRHFYISLFVLFLIPISAGAHLPVIEEANAPFLEVPEAETLADPTSQSLAVYGLIEKSGEVDVFTFTVTEDAEIPLEALVPQKKRLEDFRPHLTMYGKEFPATDAFLPPWSAPEGYQSNTILPPDGERETFNEPYAQERYYKQTETLVEVKAGERYYLAVFEPSGAIGEYVLGLGSIENFENANYTALLTDVAKVKLNLVGGRAIPWMDILGLFLFVSGLIIGLGAVTVIDLHGFKGRTSSYWTEATTRTHKITKPLIWLGIFMVMSGGYLTYHDTGLSGTALFHAILVVLLILNGLFLTFAVSPMLLRREKAGKANELLSKGWQRGITVSFLISFAGWWSTVFLFVWYLVMVR